MAKKGDMEYTVVVDASGVPKSVSKIEKAKKKTDQLGKSTENLGRKTDKYNRLTKGTAQLGMNTTKSFSKMQQTVGGDAGGAGGLVRAYALLAANVFALTAAFGFLSRSAQIDTLIESMEILSTTGGNNIEVLSREMQRASGYAVDLAQSFRQVSLASSAGLSTSEIEGLTMVAKGAAISLGRDLPDAMDRIFRGAIKLEPEILDEIGLFVRVDEAAERYGRTIGKSASALTQAEKRQGFLNEILDQGTRKFSEYAETIKPDPYVRLGAALSDLAQGATSLLNVVLGPIINFLTDNPALLATAFAALTIYLMTKAIPALGIFNMNVAEGAAAAVQAEQEYQNKIAQTMGMKDTKKMREIDTGIGSAEETLKIRKKEEKSRKDFWTSEAKGQQKNQKDLKKNLGVRKRSQAVEDRIKFLKSKQGKLSDETNAKIEKELKIRKAESIELKKHIGLLTQKEALETDISSRVSDSSRAAKRMKSLESKAAGSAMIAGSTGIAETQGLGAAWKDLRTQVKAGSIEIDGVPKKLTGVGKAATLAKGGVSILGVGFQSLMASLGPIMLAISILMPLFMKLAEWLGFGSKEAKRFTESAERLEKITEGVTERFESQVRQMKDLSRSYYEATLAEIAFLKTQTEISTGMIEMNTRFEEQIRTQTKWVKGWELIKDVHPIFGKFLTSMREQNLINLQVAASSKIYGAALADNQSILKSYEEAGIDLTPIQENIDAVTTAQKLISETESIVMDQKDGKDVSLKDKLKDDFVARNMLNQALAAGRTVTEQMKHAEIDLSLQEGLLTGVGLEYLDVLSQQKITLDDNKKAIDEHKLSKEDSIILAEADVESTKKVTKALQHMTDAMHGSIETVGKFQSKFLPKTAVDDVLGSMLQLAGGFDDLEDKGLKYFKDFDATTNPISMMFTQAEIDSIKFADSVGESEVAFRKVMKEFQDAQEVLLSIKNEQLKINGLQKEYSKLAKAGGQAIKQQEIMQTRLAESKQEEFLTEYRLQTRSKSSSIEQARRMGQRLRDRGEEVTIATFLAGLADDDELKQLSIAEAKKFIGLLAKDEIVDLQTKLEIGTQQERIDLESAKIAEKKVMAEQALAKAKQKTLEESRKIANMESGGLTGALTPQQQAVATVQAAKESLAITKAEAKVKKATIDAEYALLLERLRIMNEDPTVSAEFKKGYATMKTNLEETRDTAKDIITESVTHAEQAFTTGLLSAVNTAFGGGNLTAAIFGAITATNTVDEEGTQKVSNRTASIQLLQTALMSYGETLKKFGPEGEFASAFVLGMNSMVVGLLGLDTQFQAIDELMGNETDGYIGKFNETTVATAKLAAQTQFVADSIGVIGQIMQASAKQQAKALDAQIEAEKRRDGKSAQSLAKMKALEAKKTAMAKKAFKQQKAMQIASTVANTAAAILQVMSAPGDPYKIYGVPMAAIIGALGAAQVAIIARQKFSGGDAAGGDAAMTALTIGKRSQKVDVSRGASSGELGYLRGQRGMGGPQNFVPTGGAAGLRKGYAEGGVLVGERGPEVIAPRGSYEITPNDALGAPAGNINFTINAVDAAGVEEVLMQQRGHIIGMIREAANDTGERFLESVDTDVVGGG